MVMFTDQEAFSMRFRRQTPADQVAVAIEQVIATAPSLIAGNYL